MTIFDANYQLHRYFVNHKNDPGLARAGVVWMGALLVAHVGVANYINIRVITMSNQFTAGYMMDFVSVSQTCDCNLNHMRLSPAYCTHWHYPCSVSLSPVSVSIPLPTLIH